MARTKISEFSATPANNTDIDSINIAEGCAPSGINDAIRELMAQLKDFQTGAVGDSFNGPVGTTTAAAGAFTTLAASGAVTLSGGTANGVTYLNGSKVLTSGSALTFDGSNLATSGSIISSTAPAGGSLKRDVTSSYLSVTGGTSPNSNGATILLSGSTYAAANTAFVDATESVFRNLSGASEYMRLTSTGLGIGTSSPAVKLDVANTGGNVAARLRSSDSGYAELYFADVSDGAASAISYEHSTNLLRFYNGGSVRATLDSSGNLGLGVTPSAWGSNAKAFQVGLGGLSRDDFEGAQMVLSNNCYRQNSSVWRYINSASAARYQQGYTVGDHQWFTAPSGTAGAAITFTQAMTLDASGNLGIGTTSPSLASGKGVAVYNSTVGGAARLALKTGSTGDGGDDGFQLVMSGIDAYIEQRENSFLAFTTNNTERARIDSSGNLLVGTTSASDVAGVGFKFRTVTAGVQAAAIISGTMNQYLLYNTAVGAYRFYVSDAGAINATSTSITAISDVTLKENIRDLETGLAQVMALKPRRFDWKNGDAQNVAGFIAQELEKVLPELVYDYQYDADTVKKSIKMGDILPTLVKAIQEQQALIQSLQADVAALKAAA